MCGIHSFYTPRSNPDGVGINVHCVDDMEKTFAKIEWKEFDGQNWEKFYEKSDIKQWSKAS